MPPAVLHGCRITTIRKAMEINDVPVVIDFVVHADAMVWPMVAAGTSNDEILYARGLAPTWDRSEEFEEENMQMPTCDTAHAQAALAGTGVVCPPVTGSLIGRYLDYLAGVGYLTPPTPA